MITDPLAILVVLAAIVFGAVQLENRYPLFRSLGSALVGILMGMVLSNTGVLPGESPTYTFLMGPGVLVGVALILMSVDVRSIRQAGPRMLGAFGIGAVGTAVGSMALGFFLATRLGEETWKLSGQFTGTYTGGGLNFAALGQAFDTDATLFSAAVAADVIVTAFWMMTCLAVPVLLARSGNAGAASTIAADPDVPGPTERAAVHSAAATEPAGGVTDNDEAESASGDTADLGKMLYDSVRPISLSDAAALVTLSIGIYWASGWMSTFLPFPSILWLTTVALLAAQVPAIRGLSGGAMIGNYLILLFLASNGARSVVANIVEVGPDVFYFATGVVAIHGLVIFGLGRLAGIDLGTLAVASQANIGGPASAIALASARGYTERILPGIAVGLLGYAVGNYAGFAVAALMRTLLGG